MARQYLATRATSPGVERLFSAAGLTFGDLAQAMKEETLGCRLLTAYNYTHALYCYPYACVLVVQILIITITNFPDLSRKARQYPATPATSAGVERLFSAAALTFGDRVVVQILIIIIRMITHQVQVRDSGCTRCFMLQPSSM